MIFKANLQQKSIQKFLLINLILSTSSHHLISYEKKSFSKERINLHEQQRKSDPIKLNENGEMLNSLCFSIKFIIGDVILYSLQLLRHEFSFFIYIFRLILRWKIKINFHLICDSEVRNSVGKCFSIYRWNYWFSGENFEVFCLIWRGKSWIFDFQ